MLKDRNSDHVITKFGQRIMKGFFSGSGHSPKFGKTAGDLCAWKTENGTWYGPKTEIREPLSSPLYRTQCSYWTNDRAPFKPSCFYSSPPPSPYKLEWDGCMKKKLYQQRFFVLGAPHISILVTDSVKMTLGGGWVMAVGTNFLYQNIVFHSSFLLIGRFYRTQCSYWTKGRAPFKPSCFYSSPPPSPYKLEWDDCMRKIPLLSPTPRP